MTLQEIKMLLETTNYPVAYKYFKSAQVAPYICFSSPFSKNFFADGKVLKSFKHIQIELYTEHKDENAEKKIESALNNLCWNKTETYIESESIYQIIYEIEV